MSNNFIIIARKILNSPARGPINYRNFFITCPIAFQMSPTNLPSIILKAANDLSYNRFFNSFPLHKYVSKNVHSCSFIRKDTVIML